MTHITDAEIALNTRRTIFVYNAAREAAIAAKAPVIPDVWANRDSTFRAQMKINMARQCSTHGSSNSAELHGMGVQAYIDMDWEYGPVYNEVDKTHPDMVPYGMLGQLEQDKDAIYVALCEIARDLIYDSEEHIE